MAHRRARAYARNWFTNFGELSRELEQAFVESWGSEQSSCVVASSGTAALAAPLIASAIAGPVVVPAFTFPATFAAVRMAGAQPVLVDVSGDDWCVSPDQLSDALKAHKARAAVVVAPFGLRQDYEDLLSVAHDHDALLVIDSAAGLGVARSYPERRRIAFEVYSLHATKPFGIGEGGAVFTHSDNTAALRRALNFGLPDIDKPPGWGINGKMTELQAAVGLAVLHTFDERLRRRQQLVARYFEVLADFPEVRSRGRAEENSWQVLPVLMPSEDAAVAALTAAASRSLEVRRYYRPSLSSLAEFAGKRCPTSESLADRMICFPVYSYATAEEQEAMVSILRESLAAALRAR